MKEKNEKFGGEVRLVWKEGGPQGGPSEKAAERRVEGHAETKVEMTHELSSAINNTIHDRWEAVLGEKVDFGELRQSPETLGEKIKRLIENWDGTLDQLCAVLTPFHMRRHDVEEAVTNLEPSPGDEEKESEQGQIKLSDAQLKARDSKRAKHAIEKLRDHPDWQAALEKASRVHGIPVRTLIAFIEMESSWNPNSAPMWKNQRGKIIHGRYTKEEAKGLGLTLHSSAHGLAQAMGFNVPRYAKKRYDAFRKENPHLTLPATIEDLYNPFVAIDFAAYHLKELIVSVNSRIDHIGKREGFKTEWKLDPDGDMTYLYMAYNNGARGYLVLRRYLENQTPENEKRLEDFQQRKERDKNGNEILEGVARYEYAKRVAQVASAIEYVPSSTRVA